VRGVTWAQAATSALCTGRQSHVGDVRLITSGSRRDYDHDIAEGMLLVRGWWWNFKISWPRSGLVEAGS
jgi:hypothetical protein